MVPAEPFHRATSALIPRYHSSQIDRVYRSAQASVGMGVGGEIFRGGDANFAVFFPEMGRKKTGQMQARKKVEACRREMKATKGANLEIGDPGKFGGVRVGLPGGGHLRMGAGAKLGGVLRLRDRTSRRSGTKAKASGRFAQDDGKSKRRHEWRSLRQASAPGLPAAGRHSMLCPTKAKAKCRRDALRRCSRQAGATVTSDEAPVPA